MFWAQPKNIRDYPPELSIVKSCFEFRKFQQGKEGLQLKTFLRDGATIENSKRKGHKGHTVYSQ